MKVDAKFDMAELTSSLFRFGKKFGETTNQAICRWSVQTCREMAIQTQIWGRSQTQKKQHAAIWQDVWNVVYRVQRIPRGSASGKFLRSADEILQWMADNPGKGKRTRWLPIEQRKASTMPIIRKAIKMKLYRSGMAKGGWIGAGNDIARHQKGANRERIGKNFLGYAQKHARFGSARKPRRSLKPYALMTNRAGHVALPYVLSKSADKKAIRRGLTNTLKYYKRAIRAMERRRL